MGLESGKEEPEIEIQLSAGSGLYTALIRAMGDAR